MDVPAFSAAQAVENGSNLEITFFKLRVQMRHGRRILDHKDLVFVDAVSVDTIGKGIARMFGYRHVND